MQTVVNSCCFCQTKLIFCKIFLPALIHGLGSTILECWHFLNSVKAAKVWTFAVWWKMERIFCLARGAFPASFMVIWLLQSCGPHDCLKGCYANIRSTIYSIVATAYLHLTIVGILFPVNMEPEFPILAKPLYPCHIDDNKAFPLCISIVALTHLLKNLWTTISCSLQTSAKVSC